MKEQVISFDTKEQNVFFTSDTHFWHENIIKFCNRPFSSIEEMNDTIIENWNKVVDENKITTEDFWLKETKTSYIKPYMDYRAITCKTSKQYKFIQREDVNEDERGFLMQDGELCCTWRIFWRYWRKVHIYFIEWK